MPITLADIYKPAQQEIPCAVACGDALELAGTPYIIGSAGVQTAIIINPLTGIRLGTCFAAIHLAHITLSELQIGLPGPDQLSDIAWLGPAKRVFGRIDQKEN